jgi:hypothetical protein
MIDLVVARTGEPIAMQAATASPDRKFRFYNDGRTGVLMTLSSGGPQVVTFSALGKPCSQSRAHPKVFTVTSGGGNVYGPFSKVHYNDIDDYVELEFDAPVAGVQLGACPV